MKRRNDFYGVNLKAITHELPGRPEINIVGNVSNLPYFSSNDTYDVTNNIKGAYYDILKHMEAALNFSTKIYRQKTMGWGNPILHHNGSIELSSGMVKVG